MADGVPVPPLSPTVSQALPSTADATVIPTASPRGTSDTPVPSAATAPPRQHLRESVETIVFVVVLVLLLKLFVTEAFVIPTGSMAETLYGYQKIIACPMCGFHFPVNAHDEAEGNPLTRRPSPLVGFCCPNCRYQGHIEEVQPTPSLNSGDRVLVLKPLYHFRPPQRGEVVVFRFPEKPQDNYTAQNYIKRAMGFGGETIAIFRGDLYVTTALDYPADELDAFGQPLYPRPLDPTDLWQPRYMYSNVYNDNPRALNLFEASRRAHFRPQSGGFTIVRKDEAQLLADRRIVFHNDYQPGELIRQARALGLRDAQGQELIWWTRWYVGRDGDGAWTMNDPARPTVFTHEHPEQHWIHYRHLAQAWKRRGPDAHDPTPPTDIAQLAQQKPVPVDNFLGYNAGRDADNIRALRDTSQDRLWVGDLILEADVHFGQAETEVTFELSRGVNRFQAVFTPGRVTLRRLGKGAEEFGTPSRPCQIQTGQRHQLRFANVDARLWVWIDGRRVDFGPEADYSPIEPGPEDQADPEGWVYANDVERPASIAAKGKATIRHIVLYRDIYYTSARLPADFSKPDVYYVQPGHYLCLGDNSAQSSDSRKWGLVPDRLLLGKAVFVFWPPYPQMRIGLIK
ncbi:MAG: S26 family signal peptidase [Gemmataceae bacterium]|nr:S26 family signal peptidase [Gemmataceae bacterium]